MGRDYVTGEMWKNKPPFRLALNKAASDEIIWHCKHYAGRGVMKYYKTGEELAKDMGVPLQTLVDAHEGHYQAAKKQWKDWQRQEVLPQHHSWIGSGHAGVLRRDHHASDSLLHGWFADDCRWRGHQGRQGLAWSVRRWRGRWRCSREQSPWWQFAPRLRGLRSRGWPRSVQVHFRRGRQIQDVPD